MIGIATVVSAIGALLPLLGGVLPTLLLMWRSSVIHLLVVGNSISGTALESIVRPVYVSSLLIGVIVAVIHAIVLLFVVRGTIIAQRLVG